VRNIIIYFPQCTGWKIVQESGRNVGDLKEFIKAEEQ